MGDKLHKGECPKNLVERNQMDKVPYVAAVGSLIYAQTCTRHNISFVVGVLGRYPSDLGWNASGWLRKLSNISEVQ